MCDVVVAERQQNDVCIVLVCIDDIASTVICQTDFRCIRISRYATASFWSLLFPVAADNTLNSAVFSSLSANLSMSDDKSLHPLQAFSRGQWLQHPSPSTPLQE